jgi:transcriptional regulator with XRE-family HTH domain
MNTNVQKRFGQRLRELRTAAGLSQADFAYKCGIGLTSISSLERGKRDPQTATLVMLARALNISVAELVNP